MLTFKIKFNLKEQNSKITLSLKYQNDNLKLPNTITIMPMTD